MTVASPPNSSASPIAFACSHECEAGHLQVTGAVFWSTSRSPLFPQPLFTRLPDMYSTPRGRYRAQLCRICPRLSVLGFISECSHEFRPGWISVSGKLLWLKGDQQFVPKLLFPHSPRDRNGQVAEVLFAAWFRMSMPGNRLEARKCERCGHVDVLVPWVTA